jgi:hypothetical protein
MCVYVCLSARVYLFSVIESVFVCICSCVKYCAFVSVCVCARARAFASTCELECV